MRDYRDVKGQFDAVASIEMFEAVGEQYWPSYFSKVSEVLKPGGRAGIQLISIREDLFDAYAANADFIQTVDWHPGFQLTRGGALHRLPHLRQPAVNQKLSRLVYEKCH